jgi:hypothetical protein
MKTGSSVQNKYMDTRIGKLVWHWDDKWEPGVVVCYDEFSNRYRVMWLNWLIEERWHHTEWDLEMIEKGHFAYNDEPFPHDSENK